MINDIEKIHEISRLRSEITCWKVRVLEMKIGDENRMFFEKAIKENEKKILGLEEK